MTTCRRCIRRLWPLLCLLLLAPAAAESDRQRVLVVASKNFTESYLLGEIVVQLLEAEGFAVERRFGLGGTLICFDALTAGEVDLYVEYTGTLSQAVLNAPELTGVDALNERLAAQQVELLDPLGFDNSYAIVVREAMAERLGLERIGDLAAHRQLEISVSHEFLARADGWPGLARRYGLPPSVAGIEHGLAYQALADGSIDVTDAYTTDGELARYALRVLADDQAYFPSYLAAPLVRRQLPGDARQALRGLAGRIDDATMRRLNAEVVVAGRSFATVAVGWLEAEGLITATGTGDSTMAAAPRDRWQDRLLRNSWRHLQLTAAALLAAVVVGLGTALLVFRHRGLSRAVVYLSGLLQTIPSIALLALMIPLFGIGVLPAVVALFLYSLLPILRNAITALSTLDPVLLRVAEAMGLTRREQLRHVYLPLSLPSLLAGVRTAAIISIGTATLAAFIGAGGLGDPIVTGLALNDSGLILQGAVPAALLAIVTELLFEALERVLLPGHLRALGR